MYPPKIPSLVAALLAPGLLLVVLLLGFGVYLFWTRSGRSTFQAPDRGSSFLLGASVRGYWYWLLSPLERALLRGGVPPAFLNYAGLLLGILSGALYAVGYLQAAGFALTITGCLDILDGQIARKGGQSSLRGAFLDSTLDRYVEFVVYLGLMLFYRDSMIVWLGVFFAFGGSFMVSYCRARGESLKVKVDNVGFMQRAERLFLLIIASVSAPVLLTIQRDFGVEKPGTYFLAAVILFLAVMTNWTAWIRFRHVMSHLDPPSSPLSLSDNPENQGTDSPAPGSSGSPGPLESTGDAF